MSHPDTLGLLLAPGRVFARWVDVTLDCPALAADIGDGFVFAEAAARRPSETHLDVVARIGDRPGTEDGPDLTGALTGLVQYAAAAVSAPPDAGTVTMVYPTRWSERRREIAHTAARNVARNAVLTAAAVAARQAVTASAVERCVVVEVADGEITASLLGAAPASDMTPPVDRTAVDSHLGATDLDTAHGFARFEELIGSVAGPVDPDVLIVAGVPGEPSGAALCEQIRERLGRGIRVVPVAASEMLAALTAPSAAVVPVSTVPTTAQWLADVRAAEPPPRPPARGWGVLAAVVATVAVACGVLLGRDAGTIAPPETDAVAEEAGSAVPTAAVPSTRAPSTRFELGPVRIELPEQWRLRDIGDTGDTGGARTGGGRSELVPGGGEDRRIVVVHSRLRDGMDEAAVAGVLERRAAERGGIIRDLDADTTFGDRSVIAYTEVPEEFSTVRWFVVVDRGWQVAVGCQFLVGEWAGIGKECEQAVHTLAVE
ncbi:type VII secretion-associated protein [Rhodococcus sp. NPDC003383]